ncbi:MmgE/PrpD family protein [Chloroflexota bacterium]
MAIFYYTVILIATWNKRGILDCIGICLGGRVMPEGKIIVEYIKETGGTPETVVFGSGFKAPAPQAAFASGVLATALDWSDTSLTWNTGHPTQVIMPAIFALGGEYPDIRGKGS